MEQLFVCRAHSIDAYMNIYYHYNNILQYTNLFYVSMFINASRIAYILLFSLTSAFVFLFALLIRAPSTIYSFARICWELIYVYSIFSMSVCIYIWIHLFSKYYYIIETDYFHGILLFWMQQYASNRIKAMSYFWRLDKFNNNKNSDEFVSSARLHKIKKMPNMLYLKSIAHEIIYHIPDNRCYSCVEAWSGQQHLARWQSLKQLTWHPAKFI